MVEADFVKLRAERDDGTWVKGGVVAKVAPKKRKAKAKPQEGVAAAVRPHTDAPTEIYTEDEDVLIAPSVSPTPVGNPGKRLKTEI